MTRSLMPVVKSLFISAFLIQGAWMSRATAAVGNTNLYTLDTAKRFQVIDNFGANDAWSIQKIGAEWSETNKNKLAELLFSTNAGIGLSGWRFNLGAGINTGPFATIGAQPSHSRRRRANMTGHGRPASAGFCAWPRRGAWTSLPPPFTARRCGSRATA